MVVSSWGGALHLLPLILDTPWQGDAGDPPSQASVAPADLIASGTRARPLSASVGKLAEEALYIVEFACRCWRVLYPLP